MWGKTLLFSFLLSFVFCLALFWPCEVEGFSAIVGVDMTVEEGAVSSAAESVTCWCMMEACDGIPERPDTVGAGFDKAGIAADLTEPALDHRIIAGDHESVIEPRNIVFHIHERTLLGERESRSGMLDFGDIDNPRFPDTRIVTADVSIHCVVVPGLVISNARSGILVEVVIGISDRQALERGTDERPCIHQIRIHLSSVFGVALQINISVTPPQMQVIGDARLDWEGS